MIHSWYHKDILWRSIKALH